MKNTGTLVVSQIKPYDDQDSFPTHEDKYGKGGFITVASVAERDAIPSLRRKEGMRVWVVATGLIYRLNADLLAWTAVDADNAVTTLRADLASTAAGKGSELIGKLTVPSMVALRALAKPAYGTVVYMTNYYDGIAGGGGPFEFINSTATDNGGTFIAPDAGGVGRWRALGDMSDVRRWGAVPGQSAATVTAALNTCFAAINTRRLPTGTLSINAAINDPFIASYIFGEGMEKSEIDYTASTASCIKSTQIGGLFRPQWRDFRITGASTSGRGIDVGGNGAVPVTSGSPGANDVHMYEAQFQNILINAGTEAIYAPFEFNTKLDNVQASSFNSHVIVLQGGNTTTLMNCYVHNVPAGKYGYRTANGGALISCNGLDSGGGDWGMFGSNVSPGVGSDVFSYDAQHRVNMIRCNVEDFSTIGVRYLYQGAFTEDSTVYHAKASTAYTCEMQVDFSTGTSVLINPSVTPKSGAVRSKLAPWSTISGANMIFFAGSEQSADANGTLTTQPTISTGSVEFAKKGLNISRLTGTRNYMFTCKATTVLGANVTTFDATGISGVRTANTAATTITNTTGTPVDNQELAIIVNDANTTIKHNQAANGRFINQSGADIVTAADQVYVYRYNGANNKWLQQ